MILRRFMKHVKEQNWFAVGLDVIVVIVGIFLGLQVTEWNEEREQRYEERDYLKGLSVELNEKNIFNETVNEELATALLKMANALETAQSGNLNSETKAEFEENFHASSYFPHPLIQSSVISILMASGKITIIQSADLRDAIVGYNNEISREQINLDGQFREFLSVRNAVNTETRLPPDYWISKKLLDSAEEIAANKVLIGKLSFTHEFQSKQLEQLQDFQYNTKALEALLNKYLEEVQ